MVFQRDMLLPIPVIANHDRIRDRQNSQKLKDHQRLNANRRDADYQPGDLVMVAVKNPGPIDDRWFDPFVITQVHVNGTVTFERCSNMLERINVRRVKKFRGETN